MPARLADWVIVFDLDDTLYKEVEYVVSGIRSVAKVLNLLYGIDLTQLLLDARASGIADFLGVACTTLNLPVDVKESLIWLYRLHFPDIALEPQVRAVLDDLRNAAAALAILTDGRAVTQRLKLNALGLSDLPVYISEEFLSEKTDTLRFVAIAAHWPGKHYVYVADNPAKDFYAPNTLDWLTIGLRGDSRNIYRQQSFATDGGSPRLWIDDIADLKSTLVGLNG